MIIGTDPDSDRMGRRIRRDGRWTPVTGNQAGCLMLEYILRAKKPAPDALYVNRKPAEPEAADGKGTDD